MDRDVIARKLEQLRHHVARIESKKPFRAEDLVANGDLRRFAAAIAIKYVKPEDEVPSIPGCATQGETFDELRGKDDIERFEDRYNRS